MFLPHFIYEDAVATIINKLLKGIGMNFNGAFKIIGQADPVLVDNLVAEIGKINDSYYNYTDVDSTSRLTSWVRLDFLPSGVKHEREIGVWTAGNALVNSMVERFNIDSVSSFSVSLIKPNQILEEHTDGRLIHRITNRYIIPLVNSGTSYNYWLYGPKNEKVVHYLKKGEMFRVNNAIIHAAVNGGGEDRYNLLIDTFSTRLNKKFGNSIDLPIPLSKNTHDFSVRRMANNTNDTNINKMKSLMTEPGSKEKF